MPGPKRPQTPTTTTATDAVKAIYHSELARLGPIQVTPGEVQEITLATTPPRRGHQVVLTLRHKAGNETRAYTCENQDCTDFWVGKAGQTFHLIAEGSRAEAKLIKVGEPGTNLGKPVERPKPTTTVLASITPAVSDAVLPVGPGNPAASPQPAKEPSKCRCIEVRYDRTVNLGNYQSEKVGVTIALDDGCKADEAFRLAKQFVLARCEKCEHQKPPQAIPARQ